METQTEPIALLPEDEGAFDFEAVFRAEYVRIAGVICRVVRDAAVAEELSVEVFWKLSRTAAAQGPAVHGWLYTTAIRLALDELRKRSRRERYERLFGLSR